MAGKGPDPLWSTRSLTRQPTKQPPMASTSQTGRILVLIKPDAVRHGWGVKSIQWTARKYGGQAVTDVADHWFTLTVLLPSTNAQEDE